MIFMCVMEYGGDRDLVRCVRPQHRLYMSNLIDRKVVIAAGSFLPDDDGGLFLYETDSLQAATGLVTRDPYVIEGVASAWRLREYDVHGANSELLRPGARMA